MKNQIKNMLLIVMIFGFENDYMQASQDPQYLLNNAINHEQVETVHLLLQNGGIDINAQDKDGVAPLARAVAVSNYDIVDALLKAGADVNIGVRSEYADEEPESLLDIAMGTGNGDISKNIIKRLIAAGADINAKDEEGETALLRAAHVGNIDLVQILVEAGADVHAENENGETALDLATKYKNRWLIQYLNSKRAI